MHLIETIIKLLIVSQSRNTDIMVYFRMKPDYWPRCQWGTIDRDIRTLTMCPTANDTDKM